MATQTKLTLDQLRKFREVYGTWTDARLAKHFGLTLKRVSRLATLWALAKSKVATKRRRGVTTMPRWTPEEVKQLRKLYSRTSNLELAKALGRSAKSINAKAHQLGLKKSAKRRKVRSQENIKLRWLRGR